jgi:hypothetical protein
LRRGADTSLVWAFDLTDADAAAAYAFTSLHLAGLHPCWTYRVEEAQKFETVVFDLAESGYWVQRPTICVRSANRYYAAQLLGSLAAAQAMTQRRRGQDNANRACCAGLVRFNPADLVTLWQYRTARAVGDASNSSRPDRAIDGDHVLRWRWRRIRRPSSLGPVVWNRWASQAALAGVCGRGEIACPSPSSATLTRHLHAERIRGDNNRRLRPSNCRAAACNTSGRSRRITG